MAEEPVAEAMPKRRSALPRLLLIVVVMLVIAVVVNWSDITAIAGGRRTVKSVLYGKSFLPMQPTFRFPDPTGPEDAKVKAQVIAQEGNSCHEPLVALWMGIGELESELLRVEYVGSLTQLAGEGQPPPELGCETAVLINGENKFELGEGENKRTLYLLQPVPQGGGELPSDDVAGEPLVGPGWTLADLATILNQVIKKESGQEAKLTAEAIKEAWEGAGERLPRVEEDEAAAESPA